MCLAIPGEIVELAPDGATVDFGGVRRTVDVSLVDARVGDFVYVHAGFAIQVLDRARAEETLRLWREVLDADSAARRDAGRESAPRL